MKMKLKTCQEFQRSRNKKEKKPTLCLSQTSGYLQICVMIDMCTFFFNINSLQTMLYVFFPSTPKRYTILRSTDIRFQNIIILMSSTKTSRQVSVTSALFFLSWELVQISTCSAIINYFTSRWRHFQNAFLNGLSVFFFLGHAAVTSPLFLSVFFSVRTNCCSCGPLSIIIFS